MILSSVWTGQYTDRVVGFLLERIVFLKDWNDFRMRILHLFTAKHNEDNWKSKFEIVNT